MTHLQGNSLNGTKEPISLRCQGYGSFGRRYGSWYGSFGKGRRHQSTWLHSMGGFLWQTRKHESSSYLLNTTRRKIKMSSHLYFKLLSQHSQLFGQRATLLAQSHLQRMYNAQNDVIGHHVIAISGARPVSAVGTLTFSEVAIHKGMPSASGFAESASMGNVTWSTSDHTCSAFMVLFKPVLNDSLLIFSDHFHSASILRLQQKNISKHLPLVQWLFISLQLSLTSRDKG